MLSKLSVALLLLTPILGAPQFDDDDHSFHEDAEGDEVPATAWSVEATTRRLILEDPASWSASTEVLDENHAWFRRRRSVPPRTDVAKALAVDVGVADDELLASVPSNLRRRKKLALKECRRRRREFSSWRRRTANLHAPTRNSCNNYCCYPELLIKSR